MYLNGGIFKKFKLKTKIPIKSWAGPQKKLTSGVDLIKLKSWAQDHLHPMMDFYASSPRTFGEERKWFLTVQKVFFSKI